MIDELRSMAVFATVVRERSFRAAGVHLGLSPSVVSHHVAQLEKRLGCALLYRTTRHLSLTSAGESLYEASARAVAAAEEGLDRVQQGRQDLVGRLRIGAPAMLVEGPFLDDVNAFQLAHPGIDIELTFDDTERHPVEDAVDVSVRIGWLQDSGLRARLLFEVERVICAAPELLARHNPVRAPADLSVLPWIRGQSQGAYIDLTDPEGSPVRAALQPRVRANHGVAQRKLAVLGAGAFVTLAFFVQDELAAGRLVRVLDSHPLKRAGVFAVWPGNATRNALAQRFVTFLSQRVGG
jgi:DNA-binding transcriptional LysR family regulator